MTQYFKDKGVTIAGVYYCPHGRDSACDCRKPAPGLLLRAANEHNLNLSKSWCIGDSGSDVDAGRLANTKTILILHNTQDYNEGQFKPFGTVKNMKHAVDMIFS